MGYHVIDPEAVEPTPDRPCVQRAVGDEAGLENAAVNLYEVEPGEQIPLAYHYHDDQEEVFYVESGELRVETPEGEQVVPAGHLFVVEPDSPQRAFVPEDADEPVRTLVVGAPSVDDVHAYDPDA
ncbi:MULTISPECIES: cupin domain-containing protein [Halorussus]|uniref:cupin domain-containing protein n=1 Tax=Halorussus TaxID=1070314 RepID=UPI000E21905D|nr:MULTISPECIES: cupin domain-containing protein [Halorussus]NHN60619.1 cupin domain-containing protein [Halorussus sp. JP-T4]